MKTTLLFLVALSAVTLSPALAFIGSQPPPSGGLALVVAPPWGQSIHQILQSSQLPEAFPNRAPIGAFVVIEDSSNLDHLYENGAWIVLDGKRILELC